VHRGVLEAEVQVVEERAVGVLDVEVALSTMKRSRSGSIAGSWRVAATAWYGPARTLRRALEPAASLPTRLAHHVAGHPPLERLEDRAAEVEVRGWARPARCRA
jgi:hypothetical protein